MRLIDVDALTKYLRDTYCDTSRQLWNFNRHVMAMGIIDVLENCPAVEERKHGHWIEINPKKGKGFYRCSVCNGAVGLYDDGFYCQWCGAKMDEVTK
jgi:hypothetical protein